MTTPEWGGSHWDIGRLGSGHEWFGRPDVHPNLAGDVDGSYAGFDKAVHRAAGYTAGTTTVLAMDHRIKAGQGVGGPPVRLFGLSVPIPAGTQVRSLTLPNDSRLSRYALTLT